MRRLLPLALALLFAAALVGPTESRSVRSSYSGGAAEVVTYPWRFGYVADTHVNWPFGGGVGTLGAADTVRNAYHFGKVVDTLNALNVDFCIHGGDWAGDIFYFNTNAGLDSFLAITGRANFQWYPILGNHEAIPADTVLQLDPYTTSRTYFGAFNSTNWYKVDHKNVRFLALQNSANRSCLDSLGSDADYRVNNPTTYAPPTGGLQGKDYDGITVPSSPQRQFIAENTKRTSVGSRWLILAQHRGTYGSNGASTARYNIASQLRGTGYIKAIEDSLPDGRRGLSLFGDQHINLLLTRAMRDSAVAASTGKGLHHMIINSGGGSRVADSTSVPATTYLARLWRETGTGAAVGNTSQAWADTLTDVGDPLLRWQYTWALYTVYADVIMVEVFRVWAPLSSTNAQYNGAGKHKLVHRSYLRRDVD